MPKQTQLPSLFLAALTGLALLTAPPAHAEGQEAVLLTVTGLGDPLQFTLADLEAIGTRNIHTTTIWTEGLQDFSGTPLDAFIAALGVDQGTLYAFAINDYMVEIPVSDAVARGPIIAHHRNGSPMSLRDHGPLWIVYPYDSDPAYQTELIYARSIWQLNRIEIVD